MRSWVNRDDLQEVVGRGWLSRRLRRLHLHIPAELTAYVRQFSDCPVLIKREKFRAVFDAYRAATGRQRVVLERQLIGGNIHLVKVLALLRHDRGLPLLDLMQEGCMGMYRALQKYNPEGQAKFSTYAIYWIRQKMDRAIEDTGLHHTRRIPIHRQIQMRIMDRNRRSFRKREGCDPSNEELLAEIRANEDSRDAREIRLRGIHLCNSLQTERAISLDDCPRYENKHGAGATFEQIIPDERVDIESLITALRLLDRQ